ncbi:hypothetical protein HED51_22530 [Ochrobactrum grignonense]|nr:hypothetical protein [Brucella grignonensis]
MIIDRQGRTVYNNNVSPSEGRSFTDGLRNGGVNRRESKFAGSGFVDSIVANLPDVMGNCDVRPLEVDGDIAARLSCFRKIP